MASIMVFVLGGFTFFAGLGILACIIPWIFGAILISSLLGWRSNKHPGGHPFFASLVLLLVLAFTVLPHFMNVKTQELFFDPVRVIEIWLAAGFVHFFGQLLYQVNRNRKVVDEAIERFNAENKVWGTDVLKPNADEFQDLDLVDWRLSNMVFPSARDAVLAYRPKLGEYKTLIFGGYGLMWPIFLIRTCLRDIGRILWDAFGKYIQKAYNVWYGELPPEVPVSVNEPKKRK